MKLSSKIIIVVSVIFIIATTIISYTVFFLAKSSIENEISGRQMATANNVIDEIDRVLFERHLDIDFIAEAMEHHIREIITRGYYNEDDLENFEEISGYSNFWGIVFVVDREGTMFMSTDEDEIGESVYEEPNSLTAYEEVMMSGDNYYSDLVISDDTGKPTVIFAAPIYEDEEVESANSSEGVKAVVVGNLNWDIILELLKRYGD